MNIIVTNEQTDIILSEEQVTKLVKEVLHFEGCQCEEVSINFTSIQEICDLHQEFFDDPSPTDCISFPMLEENAPFPGIRILGDVFVCPSVAIDYCKEHHLDVYEEISLYIVHGLLHLMGYDDISEEDEPQMRSAEARHMAHLKELGLCLN